MTWNGIVMSEISSPSLPMGSYDIREMSFQNVVDRILRPSGIKMGGFPVEMFIDLTDAEQQKFMCNICYMIANECRCCDNKHVFCRSCILAWSMTFGENSQKCPFCRCDQTEYHAEKELDDQLKDKRVSCHVDGCSYKAPLRVFLLHSHGRTKYSNADVDFSRIQSEQRRFIPLPSLAALEDGNVAAGAIDIRQQLMQGRMMIHQMMLLMHLEMQLRQQALVSYQEAQDPAQRMQRLDDVMALNEQLNEVGSILGLLLSTPLDHGASIRHAGTAGTESPQAGRHNPSNADGRFVSPVADDSGLGSLLPRFRFRVLNTDPNDDDDDDDDDASVDDVTDNSVSISASNTADADDDDIFDEDFDRADSSSGSSIWNSYDFSSTSPRIRPARITISHTPSAGMSVSTSGVSRPSVVGGSGTSYRQLASMMPAPSTSMAAGSNASVALSRRRNRPVTPRWMTAEQTPVSVTMNELHPSAGWRSQVGVRTTSSQMVTLPQIPSVAGAVSAAVQVPVTQDVDHARPAVAARQWAVSGSPSGTSRQLEPLLGNRSSGMSAAAHCITNNEQQTLLSASTSCSNSISGSNASQQLDSALDTSQPSADRSGVFTEPWPVLSTAEPRTSILVSTNRSAVTQPAVQTSHTHGGLARNHSNADSHFARHPASAAAAAQGPRRAVQEMQNNRPALQLRRSSVRNTLGRPAGPASVSALRPSVSQRMVPLPHPSVRGGRQQGAGDHSTAASRTYASNDILRPRRRSEIAREIMFPPEKDTEQ